MKKKKSYKKKAEEAVKMTPSKVKGFFPFFAQKIRVFPLPFPDL